MEYFDPIYGLITESDPTGENSGLFLAHYLTYNVSWQSIQTFNLKMKNARLPNGMYRRSANHNNRSVSNDEISGMLASSYVLKTTHRHEIWKQLKTNYGAYPAIVMDFSDKLPYNLANYYAWGQFCDSYLSYLFLPFYIINMVIALSKDKQNTSSKLIYNTELRAMKPNFINKLLKKYLDMRLKKMYGNSFALEMMKIYFHSEKPEFPLFKVVK